ncbi:MAG: DUF4178 domain-containing protein [Planctomycetia bacterium]|nr:DUF4178 domain-containing protein [Planctomycetia bacterium]
MKGKQAACPACAGPVRFQVSSSLVTVCTYCHSVVARGDKRLEDLGKVADLVATESPLKVGLHGQYEGKRFTLVGRSQYRHAAGGVWDEWYAAFPGNRWGWLAEAQGRFYLTFARKPSQETPLPPFGGLEIEHRLALGTKGEFTVAEVGTATALSAEGEIPYRFVPNETLNYADLYGPDSSFATLDYSDDEPRLYLGREVSLDEIGISTAARGDDAEPAKISAIQVACPQCGGQLTLVAPDKSERVTCPSCMSLLDANQGKLKYLQTLSQSEHHPLIPLGTSGALQGVEYTVIGFMARSVTIEGTEYFWTEYLLYQARKGFRWLINSDKHWSFAKPISAGSVKTSGKTARCDGRTFKIFQRALATVRHVLGEFYWKVEIGEEVAATDYIAPPESLSVEITRPPAGDDATAGQPAAREVNYSLATYMPHAEIEQAFGVKGLPRPFGVAPNQPSPVDKRIFLWWLVFGLLLALLDTVFSTGIREGVDQGMFAVCLAAVSVLPLGAALYAWGFEKSRWAESQFNPYATYESDED